MNRRGHTCTLVGDTIVLFGGLRYAPLPRTHFNDVYFISAVKYVFALAVALCCVALLRFWDSPIAPRLCTVGV